MKNQTMLILSVIVLAVVVYCVWLVFFMQTAHKLDALSPILMQELNPEKYIAEVQKICDSKRSSRIKNICYVNIAIGYIDLRDFKKAEEFLLKVNPGRLTIVNRGIYWVNRALTDFYLGKEDEACEIMDRQKREFQRQSNFEEQKVRLAILSVFYSLHKKDRKSAREQFSKARLKWDSPRNKAHFSYLEKKLNRR